MNDEIEEQSDAEKIAAAAAAAAAAAVTETQEQLEIENQVNELETLVNELKAMQDWQQDLNRWRADELGEQWQKLNILMENQAAMNQNLELIQTQMQTLITMEQLESILHSSQSAEKSVDDPAEKVAEVLENPVSATVTEITEKPEKTKKRWL